MIAHPRADTGYDTLLNRELSQLDLMQRVLELAADPSEPLLERVKFCGIVSSILDEFFMVRVAGLQDQVALGPRGALARRPHAAAGARRDQREACIELTTQQSTLWRDDALPGSGRRGDPRRRRRRRHGSRARRAGDTSSHGRSSRCSRRSPSARDSRSPTSRACRLSLGVLVRDPEAGEERFARVKVPEGLDRFVAIGSRGLLVPLESVIVALPAAALPGDGGRPSAPLFRVDARRRHRDLGRRRRPARGGRVGAAQAPLRRGRPAGGLELDLARRCSPASSSGSRVAPTAGLPDPRAARPRRRHAALLARPARPEVRAVAAVHAAPARRAEGDDLFAEIARRDIVVQHPYDSFATSVEAFVRAAAADPQVVDAEDDRVPDERRLGDRAGADRGVGERQAESSASSS